MRSAVAILALVITSGCVAPGAGDPDAGEAVPKPRPAGTFYRPPAPLPPGAAGELIRSEQVAAPAGVRGWRILYHSRGITGADIAVSGTVFVPGTTAPPGGRRVVAWAHGTTGSGDSCAPSTDLHPLDGIEDGTPLVADGYAIVATDYEGLGTPGPHPYLVGASEARSVLDAVRAATELPGTGIGRSFVGSGHSRAARRRCSPASSPPPTRRATPSRRRGRLTAHRSPRARTPRHRPRLRRRVPDRARRRIRRRRPVRPASVDHDPERSRLPAPIEDGCNGGTSFTAYTGVSVHDTFVRDPRTTPPWSTGLAGGSTGVLPRRLPILVMQGAHDPIVPADTDRGRTAHVPGW